MTKKQPRYVDVTSQFEQMLAFISRKLNEEKDIVITLRAETPRRARTRSSADQQRADGRTTAD